MAHHDLQEQRKSLTETQHPLVAVLSCSDSRVPPELVDADSASYSSSGRLVKMRPYLHSAAWNMPLSTWDQRDCRHGTSKLRRGDSCLFTREIGIRNLDAVLKPILSSLQEG